MDTAATEATPQAGSNATSEPGAGADTGAVTLDSILTAAIDETLPSEDAAGSEADTGQGGRDERGRFAPKKSANAAAPDAGPADAEANTVETDGTGDPAEGQPIAPPERWSAEDKAEFSQLPVEAQKILVRRERDREASFTRKTQELAETRQGLEPLLTATSEWQPYLQALGKKPEQAFTELLRAEYALRNGTAAQKQNVLALLAKQYGVNATINAGSGGGQQPDGDPEVTHLRDRVSQLEGFLRQQADERTQAHQSSAQAELQTFISAKDDAGNPKYPHFERVRATMGKLWADGANSLQEAYDKAVRLDDDLFSELLDGAGRKARDGEEAARQSALDKARKAAPVRTSGTQPKGSATGVGLDALLSQAIDRSGVAT